MGNIKEDQCSRSTIHLLKGAFTMNKKLLTLIGGTALSAMLLAGCATDNQEPPPEDDTITEDNNGDVNDGDMTNDLNENTDDNDINTDDDGDMMEDNNEPGEDAVEDKLDMQDKDNKDQ
ncbi:hypothetical protein LG298_24655 [Cytobacillus firmus]|uniref:hypothetical protein n=1 Tax=Cytobacillus firmus TaxID=1399 RepID=UPI0038511EC0